MRGKRRPAGRVKPSRAARMGRGGGAPRGWEEGPSRARRAWADAGSAARNGPRFLGYFEGSLCHHHRPHALPRLRSLRTSDGWGRWGPPLPPGSAGTPQLKETGLSPYPFLRQALLPLCPGALPGSAASPLANKASAPGAPGTSVRGPRKQGRNGGAWLCLVRSSIVNNLPGGGEDVGQGSLSAILCSAGGL